LVEIPYLVASFFGGTGILIIVGVMLDTLKQIESHLPTHHYEGFIKSGHIKGEDNVSVLLGPPGPVKERRQKGWHRGLSCRISPREIY
jgi:hypothetical protein